jgi:major type 1 subunit fimbrin (pilin)
MKRNKLLILSTCALLVLSATQTVNAATDKGTIKFSGEVVASTCDASVDSAGATGTVTLDKVSTETIAGVGTTAKPKLFTISVKSCAPSATGIGVNFGAANGTPDTNGNLANEEASPTKVSLQLVDIANSEKAIDLNADQSSGSKFTIDESGTGSLEYNVQYYSNDEAPVAGLVTANATYELSYE